MDTQTVQTNTNLTPDAFKSLILQKYPDGVSGDGTAYSKMDATDLTQRIVNKYPDGVTKDGHKYSDYLPAQTDQSSTSEKQPGFLQSLARGVASPILTATRLPLGLLQQGVGKLTGNKKMEQFGADLASPQQHDFGYLGKVGQLGYDENGKPLSTGGAIEQGVGIGAQVAPYFFGAGEVGNLAETAGQQTIGGLMKAGAKVSSVGGGLMGVGNALQQGAESNQDPATTAGNALIQGGEGVITGGVLGGITAGVAGIGGKILGKVGQDVPTMESIDAVNPDLTGKKLSAQYTKGATQGRVSPGGPFTPQGVSPDPQILRLGQSLSDIGLKSDPSQAASNLVKLGNALQETEAKIKPFEDFGISPGAKRLTISQLDNLKTNIPEEFKGVGNESQKGTFNNVIEYAKGLVAKSKDTIGGYRAARGDFYDALKTQFPSAFDDQGRFNMRTGAGRSGKMVYDFLNKNLFDLAPKNSGLPELIQREADIYQAARNIGPKAKAFDGLSGWNKLIKQHPGLIGALKLGGEITGLGFGAGLVGRIINNSGSTISGQ